MDKKFSSYGYAKILKNISKHCTMESMQELIISMWEELMKLCEKKIEKVPFFNKNNRYMF